MNTDFAYEKLGLLYLGKEVDFATRERVETPFLYKNKSLTTHGVIIGMTGSGKTGLGVGIIEEAMMDKVPSIIIDPKGDMGNLLLTFPELKPADFAPWIDQAEAARKEMSTADYAEKMASVWENGLESWGQSKKRIENLVERSECTIYTPGSTAGMPVSVLNNFAAPGDDILKDTDTLNSMISSAATSLLALVGIDGDNLQSREYILISSIFMHFWRQGESLSLEALISNVVDPPFDKVGVFSLNSFFKQSDRMKLAMSLNNVLASPTFSGWITGEPLDIQSILYTAEGRPRTAIFSISHLSESERMFFVTMLLNQFVGWMRRQPGAASLKALLYMDEIFGYFPPTANPPSKKPMMILLKQARAFGVGVVLATQNPVDLDYKGLSNIGSWFVGRLQTSQDQERVVDGIVGASGGGLDRAAVRELLGDMKGRQFLLNSAHLDQPVLFETRWVMSYLKGPMSKTDISRLMSERAGRHLTAAEADTEEPLAAAGGELSKMPPILSDKIDQYYLMQPSLADPVCFEPWLAAAASVRFYNQKRGIDQVQEVRLRQYLGGGFSGRWEQAEVMAVDLEDCRQEPPDNSRYYRMADEIIAMKDFRGVIKEFSDYLYQHERLTMFRVSSLKLESKPGESLADFKVRLGDVLREKKAAEADKLEHKYQIQQNRLEKKLAAALARLEKEKGDVQLKTTDTFLSFGSAILGAFLGRKTLSAGNISKASTGIKSVGRISKEKADVKRAEEKVSMLEEEQAALAAELQEKLESLGEIFEPENYEIEEFAIKPRRSDIFNVRVGVLWEMAAPATPHLV